MSVHFIRPRVSDLCFYVYGRSLHPELFDIFARKRIVTGDHDLVVSITRTGHFWSLQLPDQSIAEVAGRRTDRLPHRFRLLSYRLRGEHNETLAYPAGLRYHMSFSVERLEPEVFVAVHEELAEVSRRREGLFYSFRAHQRLALPPVAHVHFELGARRLSLQSFHTFPHDLTVVRTLSLIERD